jgi:exodeoxyribonuclease V beta subunit
MSTAVPAPDDDGGSFLDLPLDGVRLVEASAGTGKTFTLATLAVRLVVERGLRIGQVLAVTFTEAATQELRRRIRERLALAADLAGDIDAASDIALSPAATLTLEVLRRHLSTGAESAARLQGRLRRAAHEIDLAAIHTIHGFCARVLAEHALDSGQPFQAPTLLTSDAALLDQLAADLWRVHGADEAGTGLLATLWQRPAALREDLGDLLRAEHVLPPAPGETDPSAVDPRTARDAAARALCGAWETHARDAREALRAALESKVMDGSKARVTSYDKAFATLQAGVVAGTWLLADSGHLGKLRPATLLANARPGRVEEVPHSPLFAALDAWWRAEEACAQWLSARALARLHQIAADARTRLARLKQQRRVQTYDDLIDQVHAALRGPAAERLVRQLRAQFAVALVDEFQDTDARQWAIFSGVFGVDAPAPALFLIGDPKQAIYGFRGGDVHAYLRAVAVAERAPPLVRNFRSRPSLLAAVEALYAQAGPEAFDEPDIRFRPVHPGGRRGEADFTLDGRPAPALVVQPLPPPDDADAYAADTSRERATEACVAAIHGLLSASRASRACIDGRALRPGDIAVLVRKHAEAARIRRALAAVGIAAVAAGRQSLFESDEAGELLAVLEAAMRPGDEACLRAAMATVWLGQDATAIAALDDDLPARERWQQRAFDWRERWRRSGPLALVNDLCAAHAERLLRLFDGERRLTNLLQLAEWLQDRHRHVLGPTGLVDALRRQIAQADANDETQLLRLESDAARVQIVTLHKSKGLEYPLVFLPYAGIGSKDTTPARQCLLSDDAGRTLYGKAGAGAGWDEAVVRWRQARRAEDARLLYVGLTRASHGLWLASGPLYRASTTPLHAMLDHLEGLRGQAGIVIAPVYQSRPLPLLAPESVPAIAPPRHGAALPPTDWWVHSFTQLARADAGEETSAATGMIVEHGAEDEPGDSQSAQLLPPAATPEEPQPQADARFLGTRFGVALHEALEALDFAGWGGWHCDSSPMDAAGIDTAPLRRALASGGYAEAELDDGTALLASLVGRTLTTTLPEQLRLCDLPEAARRAEMEFHFALQPTAVPALIELLHTYRVVPARRCFGLRQRLQGLMTGKIDLTYHHERRWYVLDYKSNRLPRYDASALQEAMAHSEYDLQALIYTLALHRWLRFRLGDAYDYTRDFGGIRYLFCRGLVADGSRGVYAHRFDPGLVQSLDALFAGRSP